jgi:guanine deaminase
MQVTESEWLLEAIRLATENVSVGGLPFAALIVMDGAIVASGVNRSVQDCDPTAHAELVAIRAACAEMKKSSLPGALLATSCEPCPMCQVAAVLAGVGRVVYAATGGAAADAGFDVSNVHHELARPFAERQIPLIGVEVREKDQPFQAWRQCMG